MIPTVLITVFGFWGIYCIVRDIFDAIVGRITRIAQPIIQPIIQAIIALHTRPQPPTPYDRRFKLGAMSDEWDRQLGERDPNGD